MKTNSQDKLVDCETEIKMKVVDVREETHTNTHSIFHNIMSISVVLNNFLNIIDIKEICTLSMISKTFKDKIGKMDKVKHLFSNIYFFFNISFNI